MRLHVAHTVYPCLDVALAVERLVAVPQLDKHLLKEVCHLVGIVGEHIAHGVYHATVVSHKLRELLLCCVHMLVVL